MGADPDDPLDPELPGGPLDELLDPLVELDELDELEAPAAQLIDTALPDGALVWACGDWRSTTADGLEHEASGWAV